MSLFRNRARLQQSTLQSRGLPVLNHGKCFMKIQDHLANKFGFLYFLPGFLTLFLWSGAASCNPAPPPLVLAFSELEPWKTTDGKQYGGAYTEIVRELGKRSGLKVEILPCPLQRCMLLLREGRADITIGVQASPERKQFLHFLPTPYRKHSSDKVFYVSKGRATSIRHYQDLAPLRIGVKIGAGYFERFDRDISLKKDAIVNNKGNFKKLLLGRVDAVVIAEDQGEAIISALGIRDQVEKALYREPDPGPRAIAIAQKSVHAARVAELEAAMNSMVKDGTLKTLFQRHYFEAYGVPTASLVIE